MKATRAKRLRRAGWRVGSAREFLGLSTSEATMVELWLALSESMRKRRMRQRLSQRKLAGLQEPRKKNGR